MKNNALLQILLNKNPRPRGMYCIACGGEVRVDENRDGEYFVCLDNPAHLSSRAFIFDDKTRYRISDGELVHDSAGAIISRRRQNECFILLFLRRKFPFLYTIPAGHVESGLNIDDNLKREVREETGLKILSMNPLWPTESFHLEDPCRRGADIHSWHVFDVRTSGEPRLCDEGRIIGWYHSEEIRQMISQKQLTPPSTLFLTRYLCEKGWF
ncbi:NUDIX hydrolase [Legionella sp. CNM-4043-24]|uniref:NUDIX hydrolase n=1 Tax=Legionella sp. CNM-4043-24 TaxID=3421646 RepID=UPI00403B0649